MKWYHYSQNNSGGVFHGPAQNVLVQARSAKEADRIAEEHDVYFDGASNGLDCPCCGDRWYRAWDDISATNEPTIYGDPIRPDQDALLIYNDGRTVRYENGRASNEIEAEYTEVKDPLKLN